MLLLPLCCRCLLKFPIAGFPLWPIIKVVGKLRLTFSNLQNVGCNYYHELLIGMLYTESVDRCHGYKILSKRLINLKYCIFAYHHPHLASAGMLQLVKLWFSDLNFLYCQIATAVAELQHKNYTGENQHLDRSSEAADQIIYISWWASVSKTLMVCTGCPVLLKVHQILPPFYHLAVFYHHMRRRQCGRWFGLPPVQVFIFEQKFSSLIINLLQRCEGRIY